MNITHHPNDFALGVTVHRMGVAFNFGTRSLSIGDTYQDGQFWGLQFGMTKGWNDPWDTVYVLFTEEYAWEWEVRRVP